MKNKKRILFIVPLPPPVHGSTVMAKYIKDSVLINDEFDCDYINITTSSSTSDIGKFSIRKIFHILSELSKEFFYFITRRYSLCYAAISFHGGLLKDAPFVLLAKLFRRRIIIHLHGKGASLDAKKPLYNWLLKKVFKNSKVIMLSWRLYPDVAKYVKKEDVYICPNGIPVNHSVTISKNEQQENKVPRLLFLSNLIESKGVIVLLDALKILFDKGYSFQCDFVGGETKEIDAKRFAEEVDKRQLNRLVVYQGRKYGGEKEMAFVKSDMFVFPSMEDCFPLVLLDAMGHKLPIVTTTEGAIPDEIIDGENGLICERNNPESLANCIKKLLDDSELREKLGEDGFQKLHKYFTQEVFEKRIENILISQMGGGKISIVNYLGKMYGAEKESIYEKADIFVFPTFYETFGLVNLEAMSHKLPIVSTNEGGIPDVVKDGENGMIAESRDAESLADCIQKLIDDPELRKRMGEDGYKKLHKYFTIEVFEHTIYDILSKSVG